MKGQRRSLVGNFTAEIIYLEWKGDKTYLEGPFQNCEIFPTQKWLALQDKRTSESKKLLIDIIQSSMPALASSYLS